MEKYKPIVCLDFDGVIHSYSSGWKGEGVIPDFPVEGAFKAISDYLEYFRVVIYSSRSKSPEGIAAMKKWFIDHGWPDTIEKLSPDHLEFPLEKLPAFVTIDDRAITFTGTFPSVDEIKGFKPWNKK